MFEMAVDTLDDIRAVKCVQHQRFRMPGGISEGRVRVGTHLRFDDGEGRRRAVRRDVLGVSNRRIQNVTAGDQVVDQTDAVRLVGVHHPAGKQKIDCSTVPDQAGQHPGDAVLRNQASTRERGSESCCARTETNVAVQSLDHSEPGSDAVDGGDQRLADGGREMTVSRPDKITFGDFATFFKLPRSAPEQNPRPEPVTTIARTLGSSSATARKS